MPRKGGYDPRTLARAAVSVADRNGMDGLTPSAVAAYLGVTRSAIHHHVDGIEGLRYACAVQVAWSLAAALDNASVDREGRDALEAIARAWRAFARRHPGSYRALLRPRREGAERALVGGLNAIAQPIARALHEAGLRSREVDVVARLLHAALHGFVLVEEDDRWGTPDEANLCFRRLLDAVLAGVPHES